MALDSTTVGSVGERFERTVDARWVMSYAAGIGDYLPCYMDTSRREAMRAHPLFPVCLEWPVMVAMRDEALARDEALRGVHATHDLVIHRLIRPDDVLTTQGTVVGVEPRKPGAYQVVRYDTRDAEDDLVCSTWYGTLFRGVEVAGESLPAHDLPPAVAVLDADRVVTPRAEIPVSISAGAAHVYTECARIWNPIHTDPAVAEQFGLPGLILHGTATLAHGVSRVVAAEADGQPTRVKRVAGRFGAMVCMPSELTVRIVARRSDAQGVLIRFEVVTEDGKPAIRDGLVVLSD